MWTILWWNINICSKLIHFILQGSFPDPRQDDEWIKLNYKQFGFYRVNYEADMWAALAAQLSADHEVCVSSGRPLLNTIVNVLFSYFNIELE